MSFEEHAEEFAGLPVVDFPAPGAGPLPQVEPDRVAWRLSAGVSWEPLSSADADRAAADALYRSFLEQVDPARVTAIVTGMIVSPGAWYEASGHRDRLLRHAAALPNLRALFVGDVVSMESEVASMQLCDPTPLLEAFPRLEELRLRGGFQALEGQIPFAPFRHAALRTLVFESGGLAAEAIRAVGRSEIPELEHLEFYFGDRAAPGAARGPVRHERAGALRRARVCGP